MHTVAIVQARTTSARLPGKVLSDICGEPVLARVLQRATASLEIDEVVLATTTNTSDDELILIAERLGIRWYRGSETDVLSRYSGAANESKAEVIVRLTADNPLLDPSLVDLVCSRLIESIGTCDYASNTVVKSYPVGLNVEAFYLDTLMRLNRLALYAEEREHVTLALYRRLANLFSRHDIVDTVDNSDLRLTLDYSEDLTVIREAYSALGLEHCNIPYAELIAWFRSHPEIANLNSVHSACTTRPYPAGQ